MTSPSVDAAHVDCVARYYRAERMAADLVRERDAALARAERAEAVLRKWVDRAVASVDSELPPNAWDDIIEEVVSILGLKLVRATRP